MPKKKIARNESELPRNVKRKRQYARMGREGGDHAQRNAAIDAMTAAGEKRLSILSVAAKEKVKINDSILPAIPVPVMGAAGSAEGRAEKRSRLKASRAIGNMPKRKWATVDGKVRRIRNRTPMPGTQAHYLSTH